MIISTGIDLIDIKRIEKLLKQQGRRFENRVFTKAEQKKAQSRKATVAATYAKRYAAKEACVKALGGRGMSWQDIEITNSKNGAPAITLRGGALKVLKSITPKGTKARILLSLTDEYPFALAQVIIVADD